MTEKLKNMLTGNLLFTASIATILPVRSAGHENFMGYGSLCPWAPVSSIILLGLGIAQVLFVRKISGEEKDE